MDSYERNGKLAHTHTKHIFAINPAPTESHKVAEALAKGEAIFCSLAIQEICEQEKEMVSEKTIRTNEEIIHHFKGDHMK